LSEAEQAFRRAEEWGRRPEPGLALLRLAQGRTSAAVTAIRHALNEARDEADRAHLLPSAVDIFLAADGGSAAKEASEELDNLAQLFNSPTLTAAAQQARGARRLAEGDVVEAAILLRSALTAWQSLDAPYEAAKARRLLAAAARALGDVETAEAQTELATRTFEQLGAVTDLTRLAGDRTSGDRGTHGLTPRELEVLRLVAAGMTNRAIAANLTISEKTVANHVGNILGKLGLSSRAAATAYAYQHGLI
jgi:DNA-binding CsgD family transcriptional regulator